MADWNAPPTEDELRAAGWDTPPTPDEMGASAAPPAPGWLDKVLGVAKATSPAAWLVSKIAESGPVSPTKFSQKLGEGMLPGFNRVVALGQSATDPLFGQSDEFGGDDFWTRYRTHLAAEQGQSRETQAEHPIASGVLQAAGAVPSAVALGVTPAVGRLPSVIQGVTQGAGFGGAYAAGDAPAGSDAGRMLGEFAKGAGTGGVLGGAFGAAMPGLPRVPQGGELPAAPPTITDDLAAWLREKAGNRNIKAAGGIQSDITRARKQLGPGGANDGRAQLQEIGAEMGEKGLVSPLSTPTKTFDRAVTLMDDAGGRMGQILDAADASGGPRPAIQTVFAAGDDILKGLQSNPHTAAGVSTEHLGMGHGGGHSAADMFAGLLAKYRRIYGDGPVTFRQLHEIRKNISDDLYGLRGTKDPWADAYKSALHDLRSAVSSEIDASLDTAIAAAPAWKAANRDYQVASKALEFADKGMDRAVGNNLVSPMEMIAALTGAGIGSSHGGAGLTLGGLAAMGGTALARRHGSGILGAGALEASNALRSTRLPSASLPNASPATVDPLILQVLEALKRRGVAAEPVPAVAGEDR